MVWFMRLALNWYGIWISRLSLIIPVPSMRNGHTNRQKSWGNYQNIEGAEPEQIKFRMSLDFNLATIHFWWKGHWICIFFTERAPGVTLHRAKCKYVKINKNFSKNKKKGWIFLLQHNVHTGCKMHAGHYNKHYQRVSTAHYMIIMHIGKTISLLQSTQL